MKEFFKNLKVWWHTPKLHAVMVLCFWFLFFLICFGSLGLMSHFKSPVSQERKSYQLNNMNNYECHYVFTINDTKYYLTGNRYQNKELVEVENPVQTFIITDHKNIDLLKKIDFIMLRPENIYEWIKKAVTKKTIDYQNNEVKTTYQIKASDVLIAPVQTNDEFIYLSILQTSNYIKKIILNVTPIMSKVDKSINNYQIEISYQKLDQIKDFAVD